MRSPRDPVVRFLVLAFAGSWLLEAPMVLGRQGLGLFDYQVPLPLYAALFIASVFAGPTGAALVLTRTLEGRAGLAGFFRRYGQWRVGWLPMFLAVLGAPLLYLGLVAGVAGWSGLATVARRGTSFLTVYLPALLVFPAFITWGEEPGWKGFALTRLQARTGALAASLVIGLAHGMMHLSTFLLREGPVAAGPFTAARFGLNTAVIVAFTVIWTWIFNRAGQSILIAVLLHASLNATQGWVRAIDPGLAARVGRPMPLVVAGLAVLTILASRGRLGLGPGGR